MASTSPGATRNDSRRARGAPRSNDSVTFSNTTSPRTAGSRPTGDRARLLDFDRRVEDLRHAAQRHARRGEVGVEAHQRLQRRQEPHLVRHEGDEGADGQLPSITRRPP